KRGTFAGGFGPQTIGDTQQHEAGDGVHHRVVRIQVVVVLGEAAQAVAHFIVVAGAVGGNHVQGAGEAHAAVIATLGRLAQFGHGIDVVRGQHRQDVPQRGTDAARYAPPFLVVQALGGALYLGGDVARNTQGNIRGGVVQQG